MDTTDWPSVNALVRPLVAGLIADARALRIGVAAGAQGETLVDAGAAHAGGTEAGLRIAAICLGGLGAVSCGPFSAVPDWPFAVMVRSSHPVAACLASQYAGWSLSEGDGKGAYQVLGSGPGRAMAGREELFAELGYRDTGDHATFVLETAAPPPAALVARIAEACRLPASGLAFLYAPTQSLAGSVQVVARVLEVALHKAHVLGFPLADIVDGAGVAPLCPPSPDFVAAMGRTNDAIIYGGQVRLHVTGTEADARDLAERLPSRASRDYGEPFAEVFRRFGHDFYAIDPMLFSPAAVAVTALATGRTFRAGAVAPELVERSFGG